MTQDELKAEVGRAALAYVTPGSVLGVGTGSTVDKFIDALAASGMPLAGAVSSSERSTQRLRAHGIRVVEASEVERLSVYIDGADEIDGRGCMIKGGGGALTCEKIVADLAERFVCIADGSKLVEVLGRYPLPVEVVAAPPSPAPPSPPPSQTEADDFAADHPLRILVVDDSAVNRRLCELMLRRLGYAPESAVDGQEAWERQGSFNPDLILMDVQMPRLDDLEATRRIRAATGRPERPWIVAVTAFSSAEEREAALQAGMNDLLAKPLKAEDLKASLVAAHASCRRTSP